MQKYLLELLNPENFSGFFCRKFSPLPSLGSGKFSFSLQTLSWSKSDFCWHCSLKRKSYSSHLSWVIFPPLCSFTCARPIYLTLILSACKTNKLIHPVFHLPPNRKSRDTFLKWDSYPLLMGKHQCPKCCCINLFLWHFQVRNLSSETFNEIHRTHTAAHLLSVNIR